MKCSLELEKARETDEPLKSLDPDHDVLFRLHGQGGFVDDFEHIDLLAMPRDSEHSCL